MNAKSWWEIRSVKYKGFDVDTERWSEVHGEPLKDETYGSPDEAAEAFFRSKKTNNQFVPPDGSFGLCWSVEIQEVREADGKKFDGERCEYFITNRWDEGREKYYLDYAYADELDQIFEVEGKSARRRANKAEAQLREDVRGQSEDGEHDLDQGYEEDEQEVEEREP